MSLQTAVSVRSRLWDSWSKNRTEYRRMRLRRSKDIIWHPRKLPSCDASLREEYSVFIRSVSGDVLHLLRHRLLRGEHVIVVHASFLDLGFDRWCGGCGGSGPSSKWEGSRYGSWVRTCS